jgi:flagellar hook-associated protein 1
LHYGSKLQSGNMTIWMYDANGQVSGNFQLDFSGSPTGDINFDHTSNNLTHVMDAINASGADVTASIVNDRLQIAADNAGETFAFGSDSTGLLAALGINTFFDGTDARGFSLNQEVFNNLSLINAGHVNGAGEINAGDNETAKAIAELQYEKVDFRTTFQGQSSQTLQNFYGSLVGDAGAATANARFNFNYHKALADDLQNRQEEISGVNLDEEMSSLIKFQHSYSAAAKLISTADQMFQTILSMK